MDTDKSFWAIFLSIAIIGTVTWLAIFEHNYQPRIYRYNEDVIILEVGDSELDFNHPEGAFTIWLQSGRRSVRVGSPFHSCPTGIFEVRIAASPVRGKANEALVEFLAQALGVGKGQVEIARGQRARNKTIRVRGLSEKEARKRLRNLTAS